MKAPQIPKNDIDTTIGKVFKAQRKKMHITQVEMGDKIGISEKYVSRLENGYSGIKLQTLVKYVDALGITPNAVFRDLVTNKDVKTQVRISQKISLLPKNKLKYLEKMIDELRKV